MVQQLWWLCWRCHLACCCLLIQSPLIQSHLAGLSESNGRTDSYMYWNNYNSILLVGCHIVITGMHILRVQVWRTPCTAPYVRVPHPPSLVPRLIIARGMRLTPPPLHCPFWIIHMFRKIDTDLNGTETKINIVKGSPNYSRVVHQSDSSILS